ncbi:hypothetical protein [Massilia brevitalea]|uniref:hypothetical protein n=1 Tax=Massilia brevitalea TaxID=442526 RepID=UPI0027389428|nr:hypothetical protein [Massilia brevitalea]
MLTRLRNLFGARAARAPAAPPVVQHAVAAPLEVASGSAPAFRVAEHCWGQQGYPIMDWAAAARWVDVLPAEEQASAWIAIERAWLLHLRDALGAGFRLTESGNCLLLAALEDNVANAALGFMERTLKRVVRTLDGIAQVTPEGKDILIVFDDEDSYYRYVSHAYPGGGEFANSGGMYINGGCGHFVTVRRDLSAIEPVIAHEMTHGCLAHLPIPLWLNEGLAVNTEQRLTGVQGSVHTPQELRGMQLAFWSEATIREFWSGHAFQRLDDGNLLSYDLARILVAYMAKDWAAFRPFVLAAHHADGGAQAARDCLGADLGELVCALLGQAHAPEWSPAPFARIPE